MPRGIKMMLLASESFFFQEARSLPALAALSRQFVAATMPPASKGPGPNERVIAFGPAWRN